MSNYYWVRFTFFAVYNSSCTLFFKDHIYTGDEPPEDSSLELLLEAVELSSYWRLGYFFEEVQRTIVKRRLITPFTLDCSKFSSCLYDLFANFTPALVRETAERAKAEVLLQLGQEYEEKNVVYIRKVRSST